MEYCDKDQFDKLPPSFRDAELKRKVRKMGWEERAAFIELARGDMYKHMFYAARNGSKVRRTVRALVGSATSIWKGRCMLSEGPWSERTLGCGDMYTSSCPL